MKRVLIVDDESIVRVALRSLADWEKYGFTVVRDCMGGLQAVEYMKENPVELLITDMKMPLKWKHDALPIFAVFPFQRRGHGPHGYGACGNQPSQGRQVWDHSF